MINGVLHPSYGFDADPVGGFNLAPQGSHEPLLEFSKWKTICAIRERMRTKLEFGRQYDLSFSIHPTLWIIGGRP